MKKAKLALAGKPLTEYVNQNEAEEGAAYANITYGNNLSPYQCNNCNNWHLSSKDRQTPSIKCPEYTDVNGYLKTSTNHLKAL